MGNLPTFTIQINHSCTVGKYTVRPMDPVGYRHTSLMNPLGTGQARLGRAMNVSLQGGS